MSDDLFYSTVVGAVTPETSGTTNPSDWFVRWVQGSTENDSGVTVNESTVLTSGPVFQAVTVIAGDLAQLPIHLYRRLDDRNKERDKAHPAARLLADEPNPEILPSTFKETLMSWALLWGNGCAWIERNGRGEPTKLTPLRPDCTSLERGDDERLWYVYRFGGKEWRFAQENVLHIQGLGSSLWGYSVIDKAASSFGLNLALQKHGATTFKNGARPGGVIELDGRMNRDDRADFRREWDEMHRGVENAHKVAILQQGAKFHILTVPNDAAQWLESRKFSREEVAAWFNLPPHKLGAMENSAVRANLEEQNRDYLNTTLMRWITKWQEECRRKLLTRKQFLGDTHFFRFQTAALLRADIKSRYEAYAIGRQWGWESVNDIMDKEDRNGIGEQGDVYLQPLNMVDTAQPQEAPKEQQQDPPPDQQQDQQMSDTQAKAAVSIVLRETADRMCRIEAEKIRRAAKSQNFVESVTGFYSSFRPTLIGALRPVSEVSTVLGVPSGDLCELVESYCSSACERVLDIAGSVSTTDDLRDAVENMSWEASSHQLTNLFLKGNGHEVVSSCG